MSDNSDEQKISSDVKRAIHDLNNIFTSNLTSIEQLRNLLNENDNAKTLLTGLSINSTRAIDIINSLTLSTKKLKQLISIENIIPIVKSILRVSEFF